MQDPTALIHFVNIDTDKVQKVLTTHIPRTGDEVRFSDTFYEVKQVVWVYDEPTVPYNRVNVGIKKIGG